MVKRESSTWRLLSAKYEALTIGQWMVAWAIGDEGDLSNLKLQKLLYYAQGHHLGAHDEPLFRDPIEAWSHGPVVPDVYHKFKMFGSADVELADEFNWSAVDKKTTQFLIAIWNAYGIFGAWRLRNMTHAEPPYKISYDPESRGVEIPLELMEKHFKSRPALA